MDNIRNIKEEDIPYVVDIQISGWKNAYKGIIDDKYLENMNRNERIERRKKDYNNLSFIVAEKDGKVVGFCRYSDKVISKDGEKYDSEILALYTDYRFKQQGIGRKMINYAVKDLKSKSKNNIIIWCLKDNYPSRIFYEKMGGKIVGEHQIDIGGKLYQEVGFGYNI